LRNLHDPTPQLVISKGHIVSEKSALLSPFPKPDWKRFSSTLERESKWRAKKEFFEIPIKGMAEEQNFSFPVIRLISTVITRIKRVEFPVRRGLINVSAVDGFCRVAALDRRGKWIANGILEGYAERIEGIASTFNTAMDILVIGQNPSAMASAVNQVLQMGGGIVALEKGKVVFEFPLPRRHDVRRDPQNGERKPNRISSNRGYLMTRSTRSSFCSTIFAGGQNRKGVVNIAKDEVLWPARMLHS
jgi:adenine deaminase